MIDDERLEADMSLHKTQNEGNFERNDMSLNKIKKYRCDIDITETLNLKYGDKIYKNKA